MVSYSWDWEYVLNCFKFGFQIPFESPRTFSSIKGLEGVVGDKIKKEKEDGKVVGPFDSPPVSTLWVFPLEIVPKKASSEYQLISLLTPKGNW